MKLFLFAFASWTLGGLSVVAEGAEAKLLKSEKPAPPGRLLLEQLDRVEDARTLEDRRREISSGMRALMTADRDTLLAAMDAALREGSLLGETRRMLLEQCADRYPDEAIVRQATLGSHERSREAAMAVWHTVAKVDPARAMAAAQTLFEPTSSFFRSSLVKSREATWVARDIAEAAGAVWFAREGVGAMWRLGMLPHAEMIDDGLFHGMCDAAATPDDQLALLSWMVGPGRTQVERFHKGYDWYNDVLMQAAAQDLPKARAWLEREFPARTRRKSNMPADWDVENFRCVLFNAWAGTAPRAAADWIMAQYIADDLDARSELVRCVQVIADDATEGMEAGLQWLETYKDSPYFYETVVELAGMAQTQTLDDTDLRAIAAWLATLPLSTRERFFICSRNEFVMESPHFTLTTGDRFLQWCCPNAAERGQLIEHLHGVLKKDAWDPRLEEYRYYAVGYELKLPRRKMKRSSTSDARLMAKRLADQYEAATASHDPRARIDGVAALDWLASASTAALREVLQAHLENINGNEDDSSRPYRFIKAILDAWTAKDWLSCEQFAWEASFPALVRRALLIETFKCAASRRPDEVLGRITQLIAEKRLRSKALLGDGSDVQTSSTCYLGWIPVNAGAAWVRLDDAAALAGRLKALPDDWRPGALKGASEAFTSSEAGVALLDWIVDLDAQDPAAHDTKYRCMNLSWEYWLEARVVLSRLAHMNPETARRWLEAVPARLVPSSNEILDGVEILSREMRERDPVAADAWLKRVRPSANKR